MVKNGQFTTMCNGNRVIGLEIINITLTGLNLERSHVIDWWMTESKRPTAIAK